MNNAVALSIIFGAFTILSALNLWLDKPNFKWVHKNLRIPMKDFEKKTRITESSEFLTDYSVIFLKFYNDFSLPRLKELETEMSFKRIKYAENTQFSNYLGSMIASVALLIAVFSVVSDFYSPENLKLIVFLSILLLSIITSCFFTDIVSRQLNGHLIEKHLVVVQKLIVKKEHDQEQEENDLKTKQLENKIRREKRLLKLR